MKAIRQTWYVMGIVALVALFSACKGSSELPEPEPDTQVPIALSSSFSSKRTRSIISNLDDFKTQGTFGVFGWKQVAGQSDYQLFTNQLVSWSTDKWTYSPTKYWDKHATNYIFRAYAPQEASGVSATAEKKMSFTGIPQWQKEATAKDYMVASSEGNPVSFYLTGAKPGYVQFDFRHLLARFTIQAYCEANSRDANSQYRIKSIQAGNSTIKMPTATRSCTTDGTETNLSTTFNTAEAGSSLVTLTSGTSVNLSADGDHPTPIDTCLVAPFDIDDVQIAGQKNMALTVTYALFEKDSNNVWHEVANSEQTKEVTIPRPDPLAAGYNENADFHKFESGKDYTLKMKIDVGMVAVIVDIGVRTWATGGSKNQGVFNW